MPGMFATLLGCSLLTACGAQHRALEPQAPAVEALGTTVEALELCLSYVAPDKTTIEDWTAVNDLQTAHRSGEYTSLIDALTEDKMTEYVREQSSLGIPLVAAGALVAVLCPFFTIARLCCANKCCKPHKELSEYSGPERFGPLFVFFAFSAASVALALTGVVNLGNFVEGTVGGVCEMEIMQSNLNGFFAELIVPIAKIEDATYVVIDDVRAAMETVGGSESGEGLRADLQDIMDRMQGFAEKVGAVTLPAGYDNPILDETQDAMTKIVAELYDELYDVTQDLDGTRAMVDENIVQAQDSLQEIAGPARKSIADLSDDVTANFGLKVVDSKDLLASIVSQVKVGSYAAHAPVFLGFLAGILTIVTFLTDNKCDDKVGNSFLTCTWISTLLYCILLFIVAGSLAPVSVILSDVCVILEDVPNDFDYYLGIMEGGEGGGRNSTLRRSLQDLSQVSPAAVLDGCFTGKPLMDTLNITDSFDLSDTFANFDPSDSVGTADFSELDAFSEDIDALTIESFGIHADNLTDAVEGLNMAKDPGNAVEYTELSCTAVEGCDEDCLIASGGACAPLIENPYASLPTAERGDAQDGLGQAREAVVRIVEAYNIIAETVAMMKSEMQALEGSVARLQDTLAQLDAQLVVVKDSIDNNLIAEIDKMVTVGDCSFMKDRYEALSGSLCVNGIESIVAIGPNMAYIAMFGLPQVICSVFMNIRMFGVGKGALNAAVYAE